MKFEANGYNLTIFSLQTYGIIIPFSKKWKIESVRISSKVLIALCHLKTVFLDFWASNKGNTQINVSFPQDIESTPRLIYK